VAVYTKLYNLTLRIEQCLNKIILQSVTLTKR